MRMHLGTLFAGLIFLALGIAFTLEAMDVWSLSVSDLRYIGPLALVVAGAAVVVGSLNRREHTN
ncbi:MAG TPA: DUF5668 domain-containing protein [Acidimicrobiia bacterium]|nr:DUF5668 domain-containing protein [Acidimicrobiia bacterium]